MAFLVTGYAEDVTDSRFSVEEDLSGAFEFVDELKEDGYDEIIEINKIKIDDYPWYDDYENLHELLEMYDSYIELMENAEEDAVKFIKKYSLRSYIEDYYTESTVELIAIPQCVKVPVDADLYTSLKAKADLEGITVAGYIRRLLEDL